MTIKLKIFKDAQPAIGQQANGFVLDSLDAPFTADTFVTTATVVAVSERDGATILHTGQTDYELERVTKLVWMQLMAKLEAFRAPMPNNYEPKTYGAERLPE